MSVLLKSRPILCATLAFGALAAMDLERAPIIGFLPQAVAQDDEDSGPPEGRQAQVLGRQVGLALTEVQDDLDLANDAADADDEEGERQAYLSARQRLDALLTRQLNPFEAATTYQVRGGVRAALDDYDGAISDYEAAIASGGFQPDRVLQMRFNLGQLYAATENWPGAIENLEAFFGDALNDFDAYFARVDEEGNGPSTSPPAFLAVAYIQVGRFADARPIMEAVIAAEDVRNDPNESRHGLLNYIYSELQLDDLRLPLIEKMVGLWPFKKSYWTQLSGLYSAEGRDQDAFSILALAYQSGLLDTESEFVSLAQYFAFFDNPYRGAQLLEREIEAGNVERDADNVENVARMYEQAREHDRALPLLAEAARLKDDGELYYLLGQTYFAREDWDAAADALQEALDRSDDLNGDDDIAQAWFLIGNSRYNSGNRDGANAAFERAANYGATRTAANGWLQFIQAEIRGEAVQRAIDDEIRRKEAARDERRRAEAARARRLLGLPPTDDESDGGE